MSKPLSFYCDTEQTQALMVRFGDRLQKLSKSDFIDFNSLVCVSLNQYAPETMFDETELSELSNACNIDASEDFYFAIELLSGMDSSSGPALNLGLASILSDRWG